MWVALTLLPVCLQYSAFRVTSTITRSTKPLANAALPYSVRLPKPLGIIFEEVEPSEPKGVVVAGLVEGGNAERDGRIREIRRSKPCPPDPRLIPDGCGLESRFEQLLEIG